MVKKSKKSTLLTFGKFVDCHVLRLILWIVAGTSYFTLNVHRTLWSTIWNDDCLIKNRSVFNGIRFDAAVSRRWCQWQCLIMNPSIITRDLTFGRILKNFVIYFRKNPGFWWGTFITADYSEIHFNPLSTAVLFLLSFFEKSPIQTLDAYISWSKRN